MEGRDPDPETNVFLFLIPYCSSYAHSGHETQSALHLPWGLLAWQVSAESGEASFPLHAWRLSDQSAPHTTQPDLSLGWPTCRP